MNDIFSLFRYVTIIPVVPGQPRGRSFHFLMRLGAGALYFFDGAHWKAHSTLSEACVAWQMADEPGCRCMIFLKHKEICERGPDMGRIWWNLIMSCCLRVMFAKSYGPTSFHGKNSSLCAAEVVLGNFSGISRTSGLSANRFFLGMTRMIRAESKLVSLEGDTSWESEDTHLQWRDYEAQHSPL